jgi:hypothetical protein
MMRVWMLNSVFWLLVGGLGYGIGEGIGGSRLGDLAERGLCVLVLAGVPALRWQASRALTTERWIPMLCSTAITYALLFLLMAIWFYDGSFLFLSAVAVWMMTTPTQLLPTTEKLDKRISFIVCLAFMIWTAAPVREPFVFLSVAAFVNLAWILVRDFSILSGAKALCIRLLARPWLIRLFWPILLLLGLVACFVPRLAYPYLDSEAGWAVADHRLYRLLVMGFWGPLLFGFGGWVMTGAIQLHRRKGSVAAGVSRKFGEAGLLVAVPVLVLAAFRGFLHWLHKAGWCIDPHSVLVEWTRDPTQFVWLILMCIGVPVLSVAGGRAAAEG